MRLVAEIAEVAPDQLQFGANAGCVIEQCLRRGRIGADGRLAGAEDACLFAADGLAVGTEPVHVVERHAGDNGDIGLIDVDRIEAATEADFENRDFHLGFGKHFPGGQRAKFKVGQRHVAGSDAGGLNPDKGSAQALVVDRLAVEADTFVIGQQMRRGVAAGAVAGEGQDVFEVGTGGPLAVGAADDDDRAMLRLPERRLDAGYTVQPELDPRLPLGVQGFEVAQPVVKGKEFRQEQTFHHRGTETQRKAFWSFSASLCLCG